MKKVLAAKAAVAVFSTLAVAGIASAQNGISVFVNGDPIAFNGVGPQEVNGRVLVPLRGVLEKLGAYVDWDPAGQLVTAQRGDTSINLHIGSTQARVNNQPVTLDVPAEIYHGSTMVPLRFMSEALGADVRWEPTQYAVMITTGTTTSGSRPEEFNNLPPQPAQFSIASLRMDRTGFVDSGTDVRFTMRGTPGGIAAVSIPGYQRDIPMTEVASGVYEGHWIVPDDQNGVNLSRLAPVARLRFGSDVKTFKLSQAPVSDNNNYTFIENIAPANQSAVSVTRPTISASFDDAAYISPNSVRMLLDGVDVSTEATITRHSISYVPAVGIGPGRHDVVLTAVDQNGNSVTKRWSFRVSPNADTMIQSFTAEGLTDARPGDVLRFTLQGEPGGTASFSLGNIVVNKPMVETSPGQYVGTYTVRRGDDLTDEYATARFVSRNGNVFTADSRTMMDVDGPLDAPTILLPRSDVPMKNPLVVEGRAPAGSRVHVHVDYATRVAGVARLTGQVADMVVTADQNGRFKTDPINMDTFFAGRGTTYTITAYTLGSRNRHSDPASVIITR